MYVINLEKCLKVFDKVYVSSNSVDILEEAMKYGALPIIRNKTLCGDTPNIPVYRHALKYMDGDAIVAVQANSPNVDIELIRKAKKEMENGCPEFMTLDLKGDYYGSIWALTRDRIINYEDPYKPTPETVMIDDSIDVHTEEDFKEALKQYGK